jgi:ribonuclease HI
LSAATAQKTARAEAWVDGASRGNPGAAGFGLLFRLGENSEEIRGFLGHATNNVAEYAGLLAALTRANRENLQQLTVYSDSQLLVRQIQGRYKVKAPHLVPFFLKVMKLRQQITQFEIRHVRREDNQAADRLANQAIDLRVPLPEWLELEVPVR